MNKCERERAIQTVWKHRGSGISCPKSHTLLKMCKFSECTNGNSKLIYNGGKTLNTIEFLRKKL